MCITVSVVCAPRCLWVFAGLLVTSVDCLSVSFIYHAFSSIFLASDPFLFVFRR